MHHLANHEGEISAPQGLVARRVQAIHDQHAGVRHYKPAASPMPRPATIYEPIILNGTFYKSQVRKSNVGHSRELRTSQDVCNVAHDEPNDTKDLRSILRNAEEDHESLGQAEETEPVRPATDVLPKANSPNKGGNPQSGKLSSMSSLHGWRKPLDESLNHSGRVEVTPVGEPCYKPDEQQEQDLLRSDCRSGAKTKKSFMIPSPLLSHNGGKQSPVRGTEPFLMAVGLELSKFPERKEDDPVCAGDTVNQSDVHEYSDSQCSTYPQEASPCLSSAVISRHSSAVSCTSRPSLTQEHNNLKENCANNEDAGRSLALLDPQQAATSETESIENGLGATETRQLSSTDPAGTSSTSSELSQMPPHKASLQGRQSSILNRLLSGSWLKCLIAGNRPSSSSLPQRTSTLNKDNTVYEELGKANSVDEDRSRLPDEQLLSNPESTTDCGYKSNLEAPQESRNESSRRTSQEIPARVKPLTRRNRRQSNERLSSLPLPETNPAEAKSNGEPLSVRLEQLEVEEAGIINVRLVVDLGLDDLVLQTQLLRKGDHSTIVEGGQDQETHKIPRLGNGKLSIS